MTRGSDQAATPASAWSAGTGGRAIFDSAVSMAERTEAPERAECPILPACLDETTMRRAMTRRMLIEDGFPGQRLLVMPRPRVRAALRGPAPRTWSSPTPATSRGRRTAWPAPTGVDQCIVHRLHPRARAGARSPASGTTCVGQVVIVVPPGAPHAYGADDADPLDPLVAARRRPRPRRVPPDRRPHRRRSGSAAVGRLPRRRPGRGGGAGHGTRPDLRERAGRVRRRLAPDGAAVLRARRRRTRVSGDRSGPRVPAAARDGARLGRRARRAWPASVRRTSPPSSRSETGTSPLRYQTQLRMARARELLDITDLAVSAIAAARRLRRPVLLLPAVQGRARRRRHCVPRPTEGLSAGPGPRRRGSADTRTPRRRGSADTAGHGATWRPAPRGGRLRR